MGLVKAIKFAQQAVGLKETGKYDDELFNRLVKYGKNNTMLNIIAVIIIAIIFFIIGYVVKQKEINNDKYIINKPDTVYNK